MLKKYFLFILFLSTIFSTFSFSSGDGSLSNPYNITNCAHLQNMSSNLSANYILGSDVNCNGINFKPIGNCTGVCWDIIDDFQFTGTFNGMDNTISYLNITNTTTTNDGWGLFGNIDDATISNLILENMFVNVSSNLIGGLVGYSHDSSFSKISSNSTVSGVDRVGGLFGYIVNSPISNVSSNSNVTGFDLVGGLVGHSQSFISTSSSSGSVSGVGFVGGLVGLSSSSISNSFSSVIVTGNNSVGGLVGLSSSSSVSTSFSNGSVSGNHSVGGFVGYNYDNSNISNSFTISSVTGINTSSTGSFIGDYDSGIISNNYWNNISGNPNNGVGVGTPGGVNPIQDEISYFYDISNPPFNGIWDTNIWNFTGSNLPFLIGVGEPLTINNVDTSVSSLFPITGFLPITFLIIIYFLFN